MATAHRLLSSAAGRHEAVSANFQALACGDNDSKRAGSLLYALQIAQKNLETTPSLAQNPIQSGRPPAPDL